MFKDLLNFNSKRSLSNAILYYLKWCLFMLLMSFIIVIIFSVCSAIADLLKANELTQMTIANSGRYFLLDLTTTICIIITSLIIYEKKLYNFWSILLALFAIIFAFYYGGALLGFVFTSILTMFPSKEQLSID